MHRFNSTTFIAVLLLISSSVVSAQTTLKGNADYVMSLQLQSVNGDLGTAVVWNPEKHFYYAAYEGSMDYPIETFDDTGKWKDETVASFDIRGLWYNPKTKVLEGNTSDASGIYQLKIKDNGYPATFAYYLMANKNLTCNECSAAYDGKKYLYYLSGGLTVYRYKYKGHQAAGKFDLRGFSGEDVVYSTLVYTGVKGMEIGLLDFGSSHFITFDLKGNYKGSCYINYPDGLPTAYSFAFANHLVWIYNIHQRKWDGYKVFE